jgi:hypothetical protein
MKEFVFDVLIPWGACIVVWLAFLPVSTTSRWFKKQGTEPDTETTQPLPARKLLLVSLVPFIIAGALIAVLVYINK